MRQFWGQRSKVEDTASPRAQWAQHIGRDAVLICS